MTSAEFYTANILVTAVVLLNDRGLLFFEEISVLRVSTDRRLLFEWA